MSGILLFGLMVVIVNLVLAFGITRGLINFQRVYELKHEPIPLRTWPKVSLIAPDS